MIMTARHPAAVGRTSGRTARALLATLLLTALSACDAPADRPPIGGTVVVAYAGAPRAANPLVVSDRYSSDMNRFLLFLPLLRFDRELALASGLARSWELEGDTAAVLELHQDVRWSDGRSTTAADVVFTFQRALDPETGYPNRGQLGHIRNVEAVDDYTVRLRFEPVREPLASLPLLPVMPRHVLDTVPAGALASSPFNLRPVTNGPFRVREARPGDRWVFQADSAFPAGLGGRPHIDRLVWRAIPEAGAVAVELRAGDVDVVAGVRSELFDQLGSTDRFRAIERPTLDYTTAAWNGRRPPLDDPRVRRAIGLAIDRRQILDGLRGGHGTVANGPVPAGHWANAASVTPLPHDVERARALLEESGFRDRDGDGIAENASGEELHFTLLLPAESDFNRDLAQVIQADLREAGIALDLRQLEFGTIVATITAADRDFDGVLLGLTADPRLDLRSLFHSESMEGPFQLAGYSDPTADSLLDALETADRERARELWTELQRVLAEDQPWTFLHGGTELILARARVHGIEPSLAGLLDSITEWWVEPREEPPASGS